jgi:predicted nucleic acid-binding Zn ribbon protein
MDGTSEKILSWFEDDELTDCPNCGEKKAIPVTAGNSSVVCAACGIVAKPAPD